MSRQVNWSTFFSRAALINVLVFAVALVSRTAIFVSEFHARHSASVIGWPFIGDMFLLSVAGTLIGVALSGRIVGSRHCWRELWFNCLLLPLAFFLVFIFPHYFMHGVNFD